MIRRGPALPSRRRFAWLSGMLLVGTSIASMLVASQREVVTPLMAAVLPVGASLLGMALVMASLEVLKRLEKAGWNASDPKLRNWLLYLGGIGLAGGVLGAVRGQMMLAIAGPAASPALLNIELGLCTYGSLMVAVILDLQTHFERQALAKRQESRRSVRALFESREAWIMARDRRRDELHRLLAERVESELADIHSKLAPVGIAPVGIAPSASPSELDALCDRLDRLRDAEIRHLSHLTHPSIIDVGLHPALRGLARRYRNRFDVTLHADPAVLERLEAPLRLTIYRVVELLLEHAASPAPRAPLAVHLTHEATGITLEVKGTAGAFDVERARQEGQLAILEARIALHEGSWQRVDDHDGSGIRIQLANSASLRA